MFQCNSTSNLLLRIGLLHQLLNLFDQFQTAFFSRQTFCHFQAIKIIQQFGIQATGMRVDSLYVELLIEILHAEQLLLGMGFMLESTASRNHIVNKG